MDRVKFDKETQKWFADRFNAQTTVMRCPECGLYYKPDFGHKCKKEKKDA